MMQDQGIGNPVVIVSGLPRSGTSMMMNMLVAGGLEAVVDDVRKADVDNPLGYFEFERAKKIKDDSSWLGLAEGRVFKMVSMLLEHLPHGRRYKVIFMKRDLGEMLTSQEKMLRRLGRENTGPGREVLEGIYRKHLAGIGDWLSGRPEVEVLFMEYGDVIQNPVENAAKVNRFLGGALDETRMASVVDGSLYRNRARPA